MAVAVAAVAAVAVAVEATLEALSWYEESTRPPHEKCCPKWKPLGPVWPGVCEMPTRQASPTGRRWVQNGTASGHQVSGFMHFVYQVTH